MATQLRAAEPPGAVRRAHATRFVAILAGIVVVGCLLRLLASRPGFLGDELFTYAIADRDTLGDVIDGVRIAGAPSYVEEIMSDDTQALVY